MTSMTMSGAACTDSKSNVDTFIFYWSVMAMLSSTLELFPKL